MQIISKILLTLCLCLLEGVESCEDEFLQYLLDNYTALESQAKTQRHLLNASYAVCILLVRTRENSHDLLVLNSIETSPKKRDHNHSLRQRPIRLSCISICVGEHCKGRFAEAA